MHYRITQEELSGFPYKTKKLSNYFFNMRKQQQHDIRIRHHYHSKRNFQNYLQFITTKTVSSLLHKFRIYNIQSLDPGKYRRTNMGTQGRDIQINYCTVRNHNIEQNRVPNNST